MSEVSLQEAEPTWVYTGSGARGRGGMVDSSWDGRNESAYEASGMHSHGSMHEVDGGESGCVTI